MPLLQSLAIIIALSVSANGSISRPRFTNSSSVAAAYALVDTYDASNWLSTQTFFTGGDPTHGFVNYLDQPDAQNLGILSTANNQVYMGVDWTTPNTVNGRSSLRTSSNKVYNHGLFIGDFAHMPDSICGVWPSFWTFGSGWPANGEIDIIEGVNLNTQNIITLHTSAGCTADASGSQLSSSLLQANCNANNGNDGCGQSVTAPYGTAFNAGSGGVYAMQWESTGIYIWFFPRVSIPADITAGTPAPANWGLPQAAFNAGSNCNIDQHFANHNIIFDTTFCGDWAGSAWASSSCAAKASTCQAYVQNTPGDFEYAYWLINSVKVYQLS